MPDDPNQHTAPDRRRINMLENYEVRHWTQRFGVDTETLRQVVEKVGPMAEDVERELRKNFCE